MADAGVPLVRLRSHCPSDILDLTLDRVSTTPPSYIRASNEAILGSFNVGGRL